LLKLHDYQQTGRDFIEEKQNCAIFGDCGIGKTIICLQAISDLLCDLEIRGVLIVAPLRVARITWPLEIQEWEEFRGLKYTILRGKNKLKNLKSQADIYLINYEGLLWLEEELKKTNCKKWPFDMVIWDELTRMKGHGSRRFKLWKKLLKYFKYKVGLTGTPMSNGYLDLWAQMYCVDQGASLGTTITGYRNRFFHQAGYMGYELKLNPGAEQVIQDLVKDRALRIQAEGNIDVPPLSFEDHYLTLPTNAKKQYKALEKELFVELDNGEELEVMNASALSNKCLQFAGGSVYRYDEERDVNEVIPIHDVKINELKKIRKSTKKPLLVAYMFKHELAKIKEAFPEAVLLKSGYSDTKELKIQKDWNDGKISMLVCHPASAGHGLNLQKGSHIGVWYTLNWSLELYQQLNARLHRQGQKDPVVFHRLIMSDTVDEAVATSLERKDKTQSSLLKALHMYRLNK